MSSFAERIIGAATLNVKIYEEVEADTTATMQAMAVVLMSSVASGIWSIFHGGITTILFSLVGWFIWAILIFVIGTKLLPEPQTKADVGELLRTTGFATAPGMLHILGFIPLFGSLIKFIVFVWMLVAMVIAVRQALDYQSTGRAIGVCLIGWAVYILLSFVLLR
jgi:hypothetical protein